MRLKLYKNLSELERDRAHWDALAGSFPFFQFDWMANWFQILGKELELAVLVGIDKDDQWIGIAPWCIDRTQPLLNKIRFLGSGDACSDYLRLIASEENHQEFNRVAIDWLIGNIGCPKTLGRIDVIDLEGISPEDPIANYLCEVFTANGMKHHTTDLEGGWQVELPSTWEELNAKFSKNMRRKTNSAAKRLASADTEVLSTADSRYSTEQLWKIFVELHQKRRKTLGQPGCFADTDFEHFLKRAFLSLNNKNLAELLIINFEKRPLAAALFLSSESTFYLYQSGMDTSRMRLEPGYQICSIAIQRAIALGLQQFDFLRGDEPYKARWNTTRIPITRTRFIPRNSVANLKHSVWLTGRTLKHLVTSPKS